MQKSEKMIVTGFRQRLVTERRRVVLIAADAEALPPAGMLAHLADLHGSIAAVEAVLDETVGISRLDNYYGAPEAA